jgi:two-component system chemotaxis response regulator CheB
MITEKIRVMIVEDSVVYRHSISLILNSDPEIVVISTAPNGKIALKKIGYLNPDVVILDIEMPEMDGIETLRQIKNRYPHVGVIMFSVHTQKGAAKTIEALTLGAFDFVSKPGGLKTFESFNANLIKIREELVPLIKACKAKIRSFSENENFTNTIKKKPAPDNINKLSSHNTTLKKEAVAIGVSTGGPDALIEIFPKLPEDIGIPFFVVQHMPPLFTRHLADSLNSKSKIKIVEAQHNEVVTPNKVYIAPGDYHMEVKIRNGEKYIFLQQGPEENSCRPAVDVLFRSIADVFGSKAVGVILTGMGKDGYLGSKIMKSSGAHIIAQNEESCVVFGMPRYVIESGISDEVKSLSEMSNAILSSIGYKEKNN